MNTEGGIGRISGGVDYVFTDARGPININHFPEGYRRPRDPRVLNAELLEWHHRRFVPPDGYPAAEAKSRESGLVVVHGPPGAGRRTAALMLLRGGDSASSGYRELSNHPKEEDERLDSTAVEPDDRLLLGLTDTPDDVVVGLRDDLDSLCAKVQGAGARLVVAISSDQRDLLAPLSPWLSAITRPDGWEVFLRHLDAEGILPTGADLVAGRLGRYLAQESMAAITALAALVRDAREADRDGTVTAWFDAAFAALTEHSGAVAAQVRTNRDGGFRALLVTTGFFERSSAEVVFAADRELQRVLELPAAEVHALENADLGERLADVGASVDDENLVGFGKLAYGTAVRTHFWRNFPDLRPEFRRWIGEAVRLGGLSEEQVDRLVGHFADLCLATGDHEDLVLLAEFWTEERVVPAAARQALVSGLADRGVGWRFRQQVYQWSRYRKLRPALARVLISVCAEEMMATRPEQALVRLKNLARNEDDSVARDAGGALVLLAHNDNRFFRSLLSRIAGNPRDHGVFLRLLDPARLLEPHRGARPLIGDSDVRTALTDGWASVLETEPRQRFAGTAVAWLSDDRLPALLVDACRARPGGFNTLHLVTRDWVRAAVDAEERAHREDMTHRLHRAIDAAFGLTNEENLR
ncbi:hypothetical protein [Umezawaea sp. Da 62-37]|uniref:hypothetical protein n=1 Tax=Umezawaea sp. Da 62-37 TaxID=3075927 RepID=UPI0028F6D44C|nr:hypothetical protein [Umezawaea sp. Da 62-37]WNV82801.1 hypothetical protein RM788_31980 [Umezawaea sp. Da 62-37]